MVPYFAFLLKQSPCDTEENHETSKSECPIKQAIHAQNKRKVHSINCHEGPEEEEEEERYSSTLSLTSTLDGDGWPKSHPGRLPTGKDTWYPFYRILGGTQGWSGLVTKTSLPPVFDPRPARSQSLYRLRYLRYTGVLISPQPDQEGNKPGSMSGTRAISTTSRREMSSSFFPPARQGAEGNARHSDKNISLFPSWSD